MAAPAAITPPGAARLTQSAGLWDGLIGPGKAIDTDRLFVVSSNMLGSSFGSTNGASINPRTGKPYGPDFPAITVRDIVAARRRCSMRIGVKHLVAVAGPSYGGYQAFQWSVDYPDFMDGDRSGGDRAQGAECRADSLAELQARLAADPEWNGGHYYDRGGAKTVLTELRVEMLKRNGIEAALAPRYPGPRRAREAEIRRQAVDWAQRWDANSLVILRRGTIGYDTVNDFRQDQGKGPLRAVPHRPAVPAIDRTRGHGRARHRRGRCPLFRDRQRSRPFGKRSRTRQMVADFARIPPPADRQERPHGR